MNFRLIGWFTAIDHVDGFVNSGAVCIRTFFGSLLGFPKFSSDRVTNVMVSLFREALQDERSRI